jgi:hypothetical protein
MVLVVPATAVFELLAAGQMVKPLYLTSIMFISRGVHPGPKVAHDVSHRNLAAKGGSQNDGSFNAKHVA